MCAEISVSKHLYLASVFQNRCPRCREGKLFSSPNPYDFRSMVKMNKKCPVCGQPTEIEVGFYYGTGYVSCALAVAFSVATFGVWWILIGFSLEDTRFFWWMGVNAVLLVLCQPLLMRLSRSFWISWFVKFDPNWRESTTREPLLTYPQVLNA